MSQQQQDSLRVSMQQAQQQQHQQQVPPSISAPANNQSGPPQAPQYPPALQAQYPPAPAQSSQEAAEEAEANAEEEAENAAGSAEEPSHPLMVSVTTEYGNIECLKSSTLRAMLTLKAEENYPMPKPALDLVVVMNRSASSDILWNFKQSIEFIMSQLGPMDRLAVIGFEEQPQVLVPLDYVSRNYETITAAWSAVDACAVGNGKSNLSAALKMGLELIEMSSTSRLAVNSVLVLTDVAPNVGTVDPEAFIKDVGLAQAEARRELRISQRLPADLDHPWVVHTFGYGSSHSPRLLSAIAQSAKGVYSFVKDGDLMANAVADCFGALASSVALRLEVAMRPAIGCEIKGVSTAYKTTEYDNGVIIDVGDIHRGEETNILIDLHVEALSGMPVGEQQLVDIHVKYLDLRFQDPVVAGTRLFTSVDVLRPEVAPRQTPVTTLDLQATRYRAYVAMKDAVARASVSNKERQKAASDLARMAQKVEASDVFDSKLARSIVRDLNTCAEALRRDPTEDYIKVLYTTYCQHGFERSVGRPLDDFYSTSSRAAAQLRVGRSLRQGLARLLESAKYSDMEIGGNRVHRAILSARCPAALTLTEVAEEDSEAFKVVLRFIYTGDCIAQRRGVRERIVDLKFRVLDLAKRLDLDLLVALARKELIAYARIDILVVAKALEVGETMVVENWIYRFVHDPDARTQAQQEDLGKVPQILGRLFQEMRLKAMKRPEEPDVPMREPLAADIDQLFNSGEHSDISIKVLYEGVTVSFKLHKCILFSRCPWFAFRDLSKPLEISIPPRAFRGMLAYLYSEQPPKSVVDCLYIIGNYASAGIDSIVLAKHIVMHLNPQNCYEAYELASSLGLRGLSRAALDIIEDTYTDNTRRYIESTQQQINDLKKMVKSLAVRVHTIEDGGNRVSDDEDDRD